MKRNLLILIALFCALQLFAQEKILVSNRRIKTSKDAVRLLYGFQKGDKAYLSITVEKDKEIQKLELELNHKVLYSAKNVKTFENLEIIIPETSFLNIEIIGKSSSIGSRDIEFKLERIPATESGKYFNTAIQQRKYYTYKPKVYEIDSVIGYDAPENRAKSFRVVDNVDYESVKMIEEKMNIQGVHKRYITLVKPKDSIITADKEMILLGYQIIVTSAAGASAMWKAIEIGVDVSSMFLTPAGGIAAGVVFDMVAPQKGGEPIKFQIMNDEADLAYFLDDNISTRPRVYESGLVTGMTSTWTSMRDNKLYIGFENLNLYAQVDISVSVNAVYQAITWSTISQDQIIIRPQTVKLKRQFVQIENVKYFDFQ